LMDRAVCRGKTDKRRRIAVNDSKKLFTPGVGGAGLSHLERGVLSFLHLNDCAPATLDDLLRVVAHDEAGRTPSLLWYADDAGGPILPGCLTSDELAISSAMLRRAADRARLRVADVSTAVIYEDRYNHIVQTTRSKARCAWQFVSQHIWAIWQRWGEHHPFIAVDRQGGRKVYHELLQLMFEGAAVRLIDESDDVSRYSVTRGERAVTISFEVEAEKTHMPVALASMTAKYLRELLMSRFNRFWLEHAAAQLKPTAGYRNDGHRFLAEIEPIIERLNIDRDLLIRSV